MWGRIAFGVACLVSAQLGSAAGVRAQESAPTPAETGTIAGVVLDKASGEPIIEAGVEVVDQKAGTKTDLDGKYTLKLPPGQYQLRFGAAGYQAVRLQGIIVKVGAVAKQNVSLGSAGQAGIQVVEVVAQANKAAEATQLLQRKKAAVVSDTVSAEVIGKSTSSDAAQVVQRVPAVTIKDDKFVFVRGLSDRYSSSLLNGSRLPSTDPDRRVVPLDLFPASFLESLNIIKTYEPDLPGDFTAGLIDIHLREFPDQLTMSANLTTGGNSQTTFRRFNTNKGGTLDYLGFGADFRRLPDAVPDHNHFPDASSPGNAAANQAVGRSFRDTWARGTEIAPPNAGGGLSVGNTIGPFGFEVGGVYSSEYEAVRNEEKRLFTNGGSQTHPLIHTASRNKIDRDTFKTRLGGVLTAAYKLGENHKLTFRSLIDRNTSDETRLAQGGAENPGLDHPRQETRFQYIDRELDYGQLAGEHKWSWLQIDWRSALSRSFQNEPDTRHMTYLDGHFTDDGLGGLRLFNDLQEFLTDSGLDLTVPFKTALPFTDVWSGLAAKLKIGAAYDYRTRATSQRFLNFDVNKPAFDLTQPPEQLFQRGNIGPGGITVSDKENKVRTSQEIGGGFAMLDLPLVRDQLRLVGGVRLESSYIRLRFKDQQGRPSRIDKNNTDPLPGVNLVYTPIDDMNVHFAWSRTVSRPDFREMVPLIYVAQRQDYVFQGEPGLVESQIENWDLRWDWFFSPLELASFSLFYKKLDKPIEPTIINGSSDLRKSFENADKGTLKGFEIEGRKDFGFVSPALKNLTFQLNAAYIQSEVKVTDRPGKLPVTNPKHALPDQAPYIVNAMLDYTHPDWGTARLLYNTIGARINAVGTIGLPDLEEEPRHELDAVLLVPLKHLGYPLTLKLGAENLLDDRILFMQGDRVQRLYNKGIKVVLGLTYDFN